MMSHIINVYDKKTGKYIALPALKGASGVHYGENEPTDPTVDVWVNPNGESIVPDKTLSVDGGLADAKATGDRIGTFVRPNLLDNWYFGNPVNQRGQTSYDVPNWNYTIDRWVTGNNNDDCYISLTSSGIGIYGETGGQLVQHLDMVGRFLGETITLSALTSDGKLIETTCTIPSVFPTEWTSLAHGETENCFINIYNNNGGKVLDAEIGTWSSVTYRAVKLELGNTQTLAHKDSSGNWVLNEIPDYGEQLAKCQRYLCIIPHKGFYGYGIVGVACSSSTNAFDITFTTPVEMRTAPSVTINGSWLLRGNGVEYTLTEGSVTVGVILKNSNCINVSCTSTVAVNTYMVYQLQQYNNLNSKVILSAEL